MGWTLLGWLVLATAAAQGWTPCSLDPGADDGLAECLTVSMPLDHESPGAETFDVALKRVRHPDAVAQLWFVAGGPGDSGTADLATLAGFEAIAPVDLYTLDHRGVGDSGRLGCADQESKDSKEGIEIAESEWSDCTERLLEDAAEVLPFVTTRQSVHDLGSAIDAHRDPDLPVVVWGVSYGSFLVNRYLQLYAGQADGAIVDGIVPADWSFVEFDAGIDQVTRRWLALCGDDPDCEAQLGSDPEQFALALLAALEDGHCKRLELDAKTTRLVSGAFMMSGEPYSRLVPSMLYRLDRCKPRDIRAFVHLFDTLFSDDDGVAAEKGSHAAVLHRHIVFSELWRQDAPSSAALWRAVADSVATTEVSATFSERAADWPVTAPDPFDELQAATDTPMLMLHGGFDPTMPMERLSEFRAFYAGESQTFVEVPYAHHVTFNQGDCPQSLYGQFLRDPSATIDTSCVDEMAAPDFSDSKLAAEVWGTEEAWADKKCGCMTGVAGSWLGLPVLLGIRRRR